MYVVNQVACNYKDCLAAGTAGIKNSADLYTPPAGSAVSTGLCSIRLQPRADLLKKIVPFRDYSPASIAAGLQELREPVIK